MGKQLKDGGGIPRFSEDGKPVNDIPKFSEDGEPIVNNGTNPAEKKNPATELPAGDHTFTVDLPSLNLPQAHYVYELTLSNEAGTYHQCKRMTSI